MVKVLQYKVKFSLSKVKKVLPATRVTFFCDAGDRKIASNLDINKSLIWTCSKKIPGVFNYIWTAQSLT